MQKSAQINIRLTPEIDEELNRVAQSLGVSKSSLVRRLTEKFLVEVKKLGVVELNPAWIEEMAKADARTSWGERKIFPANPEARVAEDATEYKVKKGKKP